MADATLNPYGIVVQAAPDEILGATCPDDLNLLALSRHPSLLEDGVVIALPSLAGAAEARKKLMSWGFRAIVGEAYNVARRLLDASDCFEPQTYIVRVLCIWTNINLSLIDSMVSSIQDAPCDYLALPRDFDVTMAADIATREALERIASMKGQTDQVSRARFNPFGYMETNPTSFNVREFASVPTYSQGEKAAILGRHRCHPENEFCGRDYSGSRYEFLLPYIPEESRVLDIACGAGHGAYLLSKHASFCLGSDYLESYIEQARSRFPENKRLRFVQGDAQSFL